jgi:hypothetical protein
MQGVVYRVEEKMTQNVYAAKLYRFKEEEDLIHVKKFIYFVFNILIIFSKDQT